MEFLLKTLSRTVALICGVCCGFALYKVNKTKQKHVEKLIESSEEEDTFEDTKEESQNLLSLLYSIAEDQARKEGYVHRSITCNHCGTSPIRGYRFKCSNCVDFDLCENCESLDVHYRTHLFLKIRIPIPPLANPRSALLPLFYPGKEFTSNNLNYDFTDLQKTTHFDLVELEAFYEQFKSLSTVDQEDGGINHETFEQCLGPLGLEKNLIAERIFLFFDQDNDGIISFPELVCGLSILCKGSLDERIKYAFEGYDLDGDGFISRYELHKMFKAYFHLSMELVRDVVKTMEEGMMEAFDDEGCKPVSASFSAPIPATIPEEEETRPKEEGSSSYMLTSSAPTSPIQDNNLIGGASRTFRLSYRSPQLAQLLTSPNDIPRTASPVHDRPTSASSTGIVYHPFQGRPDRHGSLLQDPLSNDEHWPVMEAMSQDAIEEMVENTFSTAGASDKDKLSFEEFKRVVEQDNNLLAWFEALGSVF